MPQNNAHVQVQVPGRSFDQASISVTIYGETVLVPVTIKKLQELLTLKDMPSEG